jgi:hypothetical protein
VRLCFGNPEGDAVATRGREEGIGDTLRLMQNSPRTRRSSASLQVRSVRRCWTWTSA